MGYSTKNENGSILLVCIVVTLVLVMGGMFALNLTVFEIQTAGSCKNSKLEFQRAEMGMLFALANFNNLYNNSDGNGGLLYINGNGGVLFDGNVGNSGNIDPLRDLPLTTGFVIFDYCIDPTALNPQKIAKIEIRSILSTQTTIPGLSSVANSVPLMTHLGSAPPSYDLNKYCSRRYIITSTAYGISGNLGGTSIQCGTTIAVLKDTVSHYKSL